MTISSQDMGALVMTHFWDPLGPAGGSLFMVLYLYLYTYRARFLDSLLSSLSYILIGTFTRYCTRLPAFFIYTSIIHL